MNGMKERDEMRVYDSGRDRELLFYYYYGGFSCSLLLALVI